MYTFYLWDESYVSAEVVFTIYALTGSSREEQAVQNGRFALHQSDSVVYAAHLSESAAEMGLYEDVLINSFRLIHRDWNTGET